MKIVLCVGGDCLGSPPTRYRYRQYTLKVYFCQVHIKV
nr:MAG TPA: hypothetical protein [Inoviridae sp.]